jgi:MFS superfamily sulfate permease-like transporter
VYRVGREQFVVFVTTIVAVLATDLLIGIGIGIAAEFLIHLFNYAPFRSLFRGDVSVDEREDNTSVLHVRHAAVFSNWIWLRVQVGKVQPERNVVLDLSETHLVDHTVMEKLHELQMEFEQQNRKLVIVGLGKHEQLSPHPHSARKKAAP